MRRSEEESKEEFAEVFGLLGSLVPSAVDRIRASLLVRKRSRNLGLNLNSKCLQV